MHWASKTVNSVLEFTAVNSATCWNRKLISETVNPSSETVNSSSKAENSFLRFKQVSVTFLNQIQVFSDTLFIEIANLDTYTYLFDNRISLSVTCNNSGIFFSVNNSTQQQWVHTPTFFRIFNVFRGEYKLNINIFLNIHKTYENLIL